MATISARITILRPSCARSKLRVNLEINMPSTVCARANSFRGPRRAPRRSRNLPDLPPQVLGVDRLAVVDPELRVQGILGLRVADASVMPKIITGPGTAASTHMIAGRAAQLILG